MNRITFPLGPPSAALLYRVQTRIKMSGWRMVLVAAAGAIVGAVLMFHFMDGQYVSHYPYDKDYNPGHLQEHFFEGLAIPILGWLPLVIMVTLDIAIHLARPKFQAWRESKESAVN